MSIFQLHHSRPGRIRRLCVERLESRHVLSGSHVPLFYYDALPGDLPEPGDGDEGGGDDGGGEPSAFTLDQVPVLHSFPSSTHKIFLDFNGHTVTGTSWNSSNQNNPIHAPAYDIDGDIFSFSQTELDRIFEIWERVSEDFIPFDVDVTTEDPGIEKLTAGGEAIRVLISTSTDDTRVGGTGHAWYVPAGGVAYVGSWDWTTDTPAWVFSNHLGGGVKKVSEAISHEVGHTLGLSHDGKTPDVSYYEGHGSGATGWAPIMGTGYYQALTQWSRGEYQGANNTQDDLTIITRNIPYRPDDHANTFGTFATPVTLEESGFSGSGIVERRTDVDYFSFAVDTWTSHVSVDLQPWHNSPNLDILAELYDASGQLLEAVNPEKSLSANLQVTLVPGDYYLSVQGVGEGDPATNGYSDYASIGSYSIFAVATAIVGDVNLDGAVDDLDIDDLFLAIESGTTDVLFDLNADSVVDVSDVDFLVFNILETVYGDANLDGQVDALDLASWESNAFRNRRGWYDGDFNGSGTTDGSDFNIWVMNRFRVGGQAAASSPANGRVPRAPLSNIRVPKEDSSESVVVLSTVLDVHPTSSPENDVFCGVSERKPLSTSENPAVNVTTSGNSGTRYVAATDPRGLRHWMQVARRRTSNSHHAFTETDHVFAAIGGDAVGHHLLGSTRRS